MAFSGRKTKIGRSQGKKKVLVTVQKECSRLLGNLAWAYMQKRDFKSGEENYRKALSFDADKNKQCNLAVCLMHTNKLTEARSLLGGMLICENDGVDESHVKSLERASEMLAEFESQREKRWDDMAEEIYQKTSSSDEFSVSSASVGQEGFNDENDYYNIIAKARELMGAMELGDGYRTQPEKTTLSKDQPLRPSLFFDQNYNPESANVRCASPLTTKAQSRRRLQVFRDITAVPSH